MMQVTSFIRKYHICMASLLVVLRVSSHSCNVTPSLLQIMTHMQTCDIGGSVLGTLSSASTNLISIGLDGLFLPF